MNAERRRLTVGVTYGLTRPRPIPALTDQTGPVEFDPEQVYLFRVNDSDPWVDGNGREQPGRTLRIEGHAGYRIPAKLNLTNGQAADLAYLILRELAGPDNASVQLALEVLSEHIESIQVSGR